MFALAPSALLFTRPERAEAGILKASRETRGIEDLEEAWKQVRQCHLLLGELGSTNLPPSNLLLPSLRSSGQPTSQH